MSHLSAAVGLLRYLHLFFADTIVDKKKAIRLIAQKSQYHRMIVSPAPLELPYGD